MGVNLETLIVRDVDAGDFCVKFHLKSKDGFEWNFVAVYGAAQEAQKPIFLAELVRICEASPIPLLVGWVRGPHEKNNSNYNARWPFLFNSLIETLSLKEIKMSGR